MTPADKTTIGKHLKSIRTKRGQSLVFIASLIDGKTTAAHLGEIEKGKGSHGIGAIQKYCDALNITFRVSYQILEKPPKKQSSKN